MMKYEDLVEHFKAQFKNAIEEAPDNTPGNEEAAFASGALLIVTALIARDGTPNLSIQLRAMHTSLQQIGEQKGWQRIKIDG